MIYFSPLSYIQVYVTVVFNIQLHYYIYILFNNLYKIFYVFYFILMKLLKVNSQFKNEIEKKTSENDMRYIKLSFVLDISRP